PAYPPHPPPRRPGATQTRPSRAAPPPISRPDTPTGPTEDRVLRLAADGTEDESFHQRALSGHRTIGPPDVELDEPGFEQVQASEHGFDFVAGAVAAGAHGTRAETGLDQVGQFAAFAAVLGIPPVGQRHERAGWQRIDVLGHQR